MKKAYFLIFLYLSFLSTSLVLSQPTDDENNRKMIDIACNTTLEEVERQSKAYKDILKKIGRAHV